MRLLNRPVPTVPATQTQNSSTIQLSSVPGVKTTPAPLNKLWLVEAEIASVYHTGDTLNRDPITCMIHAVPDDNKDMNPDNSIVVKTELNIASPEEYSGSSDLKVYKMFVTGVLHWLKMNGLLGTKHATFQVE